MDEPKCSLSSSEHGSHVASVFLSYSRRDFYFAEQLHTLLVRHGVQAWMDLAELAPGDNWAQRIEQSINQADAVVLLATRASVASQYVVDECKQAVACGVPVHIVLGQACLLPEFLRSMTCYDARSRLAPVIGMLAQDLARANAYTRIPNGRLRRICTPAAFALGALILITLVCVAVGLCFLAATATPFAESVLPRTWISPIMETREYLLLQGVGYLALAGLSATCAWALARRQWQSSFVLWAAFVPILLLGASGHTLPSVGATVLRYGGTGSRTLASALQALGPTSGAVSLVVGVPMLLVLAYSITVLRSSRTGAGSPIARLRLLGRNPGYFASVFGITEVPKLQQGDLFAEADRELTFHISADPADRELEAALDGACQAAGMARADDRPDRHLLLLTNANVTSARALHQILGQYAVPPIVVFGCSLPVNPDDPLVRRYQWIDFRRQQLGPDIAGQLAGRTPVANLPMTVPTSPSLFRAPAEVNTWTRNSKWAISFFSLIAISEVYRGLPVGVIALARFALAIVLIIGLGAIYRVVIQRRARPSTLVSLCRVVSGVSILFAIFSLLVTHIWIGSKIACAIVGSLLPVALSGKDNLRDWMPSEDAPLPQQSAARPALMPQLPVIFIIIKTVCSLLRYLVL